MDKTQVYAAAWSPSMEQMTWATLDSPIITGVTVKMRREAKDERTHLGDSWVTPYLRLTY